MPNILNASIIILNGKRNILDILYCILFLYRVSRFALNNKKIQIL